MENEIKTEKMGEPVTTESGCDYVLPDYMGDVRKILCQTARVIPAGKFVGSGELQCAGVVEYDVLYADTDGVLSDARFTSDYEVVFPIEEERYIDGKVATRVSNFAVRPVGPRKLSVRCTLQSIPERTERENVQAAGAENAGALEKYERTVTVADTYFGAGEEREYAEEGSRLEGTQPENVRVIAANGSVRVRDAKPTAGGVLVTGDLILNAIISTDTQPPFAIERVIPFEELVPIEQATPEMSGTAEGTLTSVRANVNTNGADGSVLTFNAICELSAMARGSRESRVTVDAYDRTVATDCKYRTMHYRRPVAALTALTEVSGEGLREPCEATDLREVFFSAAVVRPAEVTVGADGVHISGEIQYTGVGSSTAEEGASPFVTPKLTFPFTAVVPVQTALPQGAVADAEVRVVSVSAGVDAARLYVKCELQVCAQISVEENTTVLSSVECHPEQTYPHTSSVITVCYPEAGDTLWSLAKKYHSSMEKIAVDNALTTETAAGGEADSLQGVERLLILD